MSLDKIEKAAAKVTMKQLQDSWHEIRYEKIHNKPYLVGKKTVLSAPEAISILSSKRVMTFEELKNRVEGPGYSSVLLQIRDSDSTNVYYNAKIGLHAPVEKEMNAATGILSGEKVMTSEELKKGIEGPGHSSALVEIRDSDSTKVYYNAKIGLHAPVEKEMNAATGLFSSEKVMTSEELKKGIEGPGHSSALMEIRDSDSTKVYYNSQIGLHAPVEEMNAVTLSEKSSEEF